MTGRRVLVCGGRDYDDWEFMGFILGRVPDLVCIIHGDYRGADKMAGKWARANKIEELPFPVSKAEWRKLGKKAGPIRNAQMLKEGKPDIVIAFPGGTGTADMVSKAKAAGVYVGVVDPNRFSSFMFLPESYAG